MIGTLQLLAACERTATLRTVVVRGSAAIYGSEPAAPAFFTEDLARAGPMRSRFQRDISELEEYFDNFARRHPELVCCMLRYQPEIGADIDSPLVRYLTLPVVPVQLGFDPRLQFLHADDALGALEAAIANPVRGPVNVAPDGSISLSRALRLLGRPAVGIPNPLFGAVIGRVNERLRAGGLVADGTRHAALRARRRQHPSARGDRLHPGLRRRRRGPRPRSQDREPPDRSEPAHRRRRRPAHRDRFLMAAHTETDTIAPEALADFLRGVRVGVESGLDPLAAAQQAAAALPRRLRNALELVVRRLQGDYHEDEWGFDEGFAEAVYPLFEFLYEVWWRVEAEGVRNVPAHGRALLVANHAGSLFPFDATMMTVALMKDHPLPRWPRFMVLDWAFQLPFLSSFMRRGGGIPASPHNAVRLLDSDELVMVFPEGVKGTSKPFSDRYRLQRFGRGGFVEIALQTGAPIVPVAVVGSEEIYPKLGESRALARVDRRAVRADHADLPVARPARADPAAVALADRVLRADRRLDAPARGRRRPPHGVRHLRAGARDDPGPRLRESGQATFDIRVVRG